MLFSYNKVQANSVAGELENGFPRRTGQTSYCSIVLILARSNFCPRMADSPQAAGSLRSPVGIFGAALDPWIDPMANHGGVGSVRHPGGQCPFRSAGIPVAYACPAGPPGLF